MSLAFIFPGQGSQHVTMLEDFAQEPIVKETFAEASDVLDMDIWRLCAEGPEDELNATMNTQPALLTASYALWRLWQTQGGQLPSYMAGHSLGEYSALVCAGSISFADSLTLVHNRGKYMTSALADQSTDTTADTDTITDKGAMAAVLGLDYQQVKKICDQTSASSAACYVYPANINSPKQVVISGYSQGVAKAGELAKDIGAKRVVPLAVSTPSHCALMEPAVKLLAADIEKIDIKMPEIPIIHNVDALPAKNTAEIKNKLVEQLTKSVHWSSCVDFIKNKGVSNFIECGPKNVLAALNRAIDSSLGSFAIGKSLPEFQEHLTRFNGSSDSSAATISNISSSNSSSVSPTA